MQNWCTERRGKKNQISSCSPGSLAQQRHRVVRDLRFPTALSTLQEAGSRVYWHLIPKASENPKDESCVTDDGYQDPPLVTYFHAEQWDLLRRLTKENQIESTVQFCSQSAIRIFNTEHQHNDSKVFQDVSSSASEEELGNSPRRTISRSTSSHLHIHLHNNPSENLYCRKTYAKILNSWISFYSKLKVLRGINNH